MRYSVAIDLSQRRQRTLLKNRKPTSDTDNNTLCAFQFENIHYSLPSELLEVQSIGLVEVRGNCFGIIVDHDGAHALVT
jgi:hypothetical protein